MKNHWTLRITALFLIGIGIQGFAFGKQDNDDTTSKPTYSITPYIWVPSVRGSVGPQGGPYLPISYQYSSLKDLAKGFQTTFEVRWSHVSLLGDFFFNQLSDTNSTLPATQLTPAVPATANLDARTFALALAVPLPVHLSGIQVKGFVGLRYWSLSLNASTPVPGFPNPLLSRNPQWVDPEIGLTFKGTLNPKLSWFALGDIGGFDVGSHYAWQMVGGLSYRVSKVGSIKAAYRILSIDYRGDHVSLAGPIEGFAIGYTFKF